MPVLRMDPRKPDWRQVRYVEMALRRGEVVAVPTDTVYGLAANPFDPSAVSRIFRLKRRPETKPILLLIDDWRRLVPLVSHIPASLVTLARVFWPGPLTLILPASPIVPGIITAGTGNVAVRCPRSAFIQALSRSLRAPLTGTSANLSGRPPATSAQQVLRQFGGKLCYVVDGGRASGRQVSTIVDLTAEPRIVRPGAVPRRALEPYLR